MNFSRKQSEKVEEFFTELNNHNISYVILRSYESLPHAVPNGDIDILAEDTGKVAEIGKSLEFKESRHNFKDNLAEISRKLVSSPVSMFNTLVSNPTGSIKRVLNEDITTPRLMGVDEEKIYFDDLMIHITDRVHYQSTLNNSRILTSETVNNSILENRRSYEREDFVFNIPSRPDELCHLVARGVFDYEEDFPDYYEEKIHNLYSEISKEGKKRLENLLQEIFFQASPLIIESIENQKLNSLRGKLRKFSNY